MPPSGGKVAGLEPVRTDVKLDHIEVVVNPASGGVSAGAAEQMEALLAEAGRAANLVAADPSEIGEALKRAVEAKPDLLIVLAGDGTARSAASLCGPDGPLVAPLAGGTMNMLPHAIYGRRPWQEALVDILADGIEKPIGGGRVGDHSFYVAAILGAPALWAHAREAVRQGRLRRAIAQARVAYRRAFSSRLHYSLDGQPRRAAEALNLMCPLVSRAMQEDEQALEVDALDPKDAGEAFRLGFKALLSEFHGDWRDDPSVTARRCRSARAWASSHIPCLVDGESVRLSKAVDIQFIPGAFRALAPRPRPDTDA
jgi:diacylglycerol kinase family enzyme